MNGTTNLQLRSRLPNVGTTIFTVMSALAAERGAINLGQGFPDFECDPRLTDAVADAMRAGHNQYPPMAGVPVLRDAIAQKIESLYGRRYDPGSEITVTAGATQAILSAVLAIVHPGDEVIVLEPCYDSYAPNIELAGGQVVRVPLVPGTFRPDFAAIGAALSPRTRAVIVNSPHNPSGTVWTPAEVDRLAALLAPTNAFLISDEVYEHMVYDGARHVSAASVPALAERAIVVSSFGKTYHVTGWKIGYVAAPAALTAEFRKVHQFNVFTVNTPMQHGLAAFLQDPSHHLQLAAFYQRKRDRFRAGLAASRLALLPCEGSYFQCVDYRAVSDVPEAEFCRHLTIDHGVAAIPLSAFYEPESTPGRSQVDSSPSGGGGAHLAPPGGTFEQSIVRLCFAKRDGTLDAALERLAKV